MKKSLSQEELDEGLEEVKATTFGKEAILDLVSAFLAGKGKALLLSRVRSENRDEIFLDHARYSAQIELQEYLARELGVNLHE